jgi:hypothetical protein
MIHHWLFGLSVLCFSYLVHPSSSFVEVPSTITNQHHPRRISRATTTTDDGTRSGRRSSSSSSRSIGPLSAIPIDGYDDAFRIIDQCAVTGIPSDDLYNAVRVIDKNALRIYPSLDEKEALWEQAHGSWKLQLATGGGRFTTFQPVPIFAYAMIDEINFGNGVGFNENIILLSLLGPHGFKAKTRQMVITIRDLYLCSKPVTESVPGFIKNGMGLGRKPEDWDSRPPTFTMIGASDKALIARGGTGGIAIWTRLEKDIRPAAYSGFIESSS